MTNSMPRTAALSKQTISILLSAILISGVLLLVPSVLNAADDARVESGKRKVERLTREENKVRSQVEKVKNRISGLEAEIKEHEKNLLTVRELESQTEREHERLAAGKVRAEEELKALLACIWPLRRMDVESKLRGLKTWSEADRRFTWLSSIYEAADTRRVQIEEKTAQLQANLETRKQLAAEAAEKLAEINGAKDKLLGDKLTLLASLKKVRAERKSAEEELKEVLNTISQLKYEEAPKPSSMRITAYKGLLPWPALGKVVSSYSPRSKPPRRGIGLSLKPGEPVRAVFWGKVVHNDTLRGFGRVVIIYHGQNYYSLYAFLEDTKVRLGQEVEKDEPVGTAGYYPKADGPGMYFELRFRQKAINPVRWLAQLR